MFDDVCKLITDFCDRYSWQKTLFDLGLPFLALCGYVLGIQACANLLHFFLWVFLPGAWVFILCTSDDEFLRDPDPKGVPYPRWAARLLFVIVLVGAGHTLYGGTYLITWAAYNIREYRIRHPESPQKGATE